MTAVPRTIAEFLRPGAAPRVIAHRGFSGVAPENTLLAFERACDLGVDMIELDVTLSRDGEVVVIHDDVLDRTTDGHGPVLARTLAELRALDAGAWFAAEFVGARIPTLDEVLAGVGRDTLVNVEIKPEAMAAGAGDAVAGGVVERVLECIERRGAMERILLSSFEPDALRQAREMAPALARATLWNEARHHGRSLGTVLDEVGATLLHVAGHELDRALVAECAVLGRKVAVYTLDEDDELRAAAAAGVHAVFTNRPDRARALWSR
ncbi:MAG: glycerophosphodiester phosphodiesterase family protein [Planctomycetota bacterium]